MIDADYNHVDIYEATNKCLFDESFREICIAAENPYWMGDAGPKIANVLANTNLNKDLIRKKMTLSGEERDGWYK